MERGSQTGSGTSKITIKTTRCNTLKSDSQNNEFLCLNEKVIRACMISLLLVFLLYSLSNASIAINNSKGNSKNNGYLRLVMLPRLEDVDIVQTAWKLCKVPRICESKSWSMVLCTDRKQFTEGLRLQPSWY